MNKPSYIQRTRGEGFSLTLLQPAIDDEWLNLASDYVMWASRKRADKTIDIVTGTFDGAVNINADK